MQYFNLFRPISDQIVAFCFICSSMKPVDLYLVYFMMSFYCLCRMFSQSCPIMSTNCKNLLSTFPIRSNHLCKNTKTRHIQTVHLYHSLPLQKNVLLIDEILYFRGVSCDDGTISRIFPQ